MKNLGKFALIIALTIFNGFVVTKLWGWFIIPIFEMRMITLVEAIGLAMVVSYLTTHIDTRQKDSDEELRTWVVYVLKPCIALLFGWIVTLFM